MALWRKHQEGTDEWEQGQEYDRWTWTCEIKMQSKWSVTQDFHCRNLHRHQLGVFGWFVSELVFHIYSLIFFPNRHLMPLLPCLINNGSPWCTSYCTHTCSFHVMCSPVPNQWTLTFRNLSFSVLIQTDCIQRSIWPGKYCNTPPQQNKCYLKRTAKDIWRLSISSFWLATTLPKGYFKRVVSWLSRGKLKSK